jgi:segregation and condensation protein A
VDVQIKLESFEGPLDLLLHLIDRAEVDVCDIPIARITEQYMAVLSTMQELELEIASEFLLMAAHLLAIKSRMLLPRPEPEDPLMEYLDEEEVLDPREELVQRLLEYKKYKRLSEILREREESRSQVYTRPPMDLTPYAKKSNPVEGISPDDLLEAFVEVLRNRREEKTSSTAQLTRDEISVSDRMEEIAELLYASGGSLRFSQLLQSRWVTRERVITTFLALLELLKTKRVWIRQEQLFDDMRIEASPGEEGTLVEA